jgi:hypothetical protein
MRAFRTLLAATIICFTAPGSSDAAPCVLLPVTTWYNTIFASPYQLKFEDHQPPGPHGNAWVSNKPMQIIQPDGHSCFASDDVNIVTLPIYIAAGRYLYIDTYGGPDEMLFVVEARNCATLWDSPEVYGLGFGPTKRGFYLPTLGWLTIRPDCLPGKITGKPYPPLEAPP